LCKKIKKTPSIANISMRISKIEAVWRIGALPFAKPHLFFFFQIGHLKTKTAGIAAPHMLANGIPRNGSFRPPAYGFSKKYTSTAFLIYILLTNA